MPIIVHWLAALALPAALVFLLTPLVIPFAFRVGAVDRPTERKIHVGVKPRLGGVAVFAGFAATVTFFRLFAPGLPFPTWAEGQQGMILAVSGIVVLGLGIWDDLKPLRPSHKFLVQLVLSSAIYFAGFRIDGITSLFEEGLVNVGVFDYLLTVTWMIGVTNAINLIDGLDGLASGVSAIAALTIAAVALLKGDPGTGLITLMLCGAILGFLPYNFNPAKIFLGDSGSLFIGLTLALVSTQSSTKSPTAFSILMPVLALGLPIMDTLLSMLRRLTGSFLTGTNRGKGLAFRVQALFHPDRGHIHHRLIALGFTHRKAVVFLYFVSSVLGVFAFLVTVVNNVAASVVMVILGIATFIGVRLLQYREVSVFRNGVLLPLFDSRIVDHQFFQAFLDTAFILLAYGGAHLVDTWSSAGTHFPHRLAPALAIVCIIQFAVFYLMKCYRRTVRQFGLFDALKITRAAALGVIMSGAILVLLPGPAFHIDLTMIALDFYFLLTLTLGSRLSFRVLKYFSEVNTVGGKRVAIYGANARGTFVLQRILDNQFPDLQPVGFIDDHPRLEGKEIHGFPVLGSHLDLEYLVDRFQLDEVLLSSPDLEPETVRQLQEVTSALGVRLRAFQMELVPVGPSHTSDLDSDHNPTSSPRRRRPVPQSQRMAS
jgi:UDP-GlcNAc:undecaprenyl-phosphate/decaprenyl-phosphate GlcNAc-1-phosphate transferase